VSGGAGAAALGRRNHSSAVVVGASIAGMAAARVLANHFENVTIIDRDRLPAEPDHRPGVPQSFQAHNLIAEGRRVFEQLFPGLDGALAAAGSPLLDLVNEGHLHFGAGLLARGPSDAKVRCVTRIRLEWEVRRRLADLPNVRTIDNARAAGLLTTSSKERVLGVQLEKVAHDGADVPSHLEAELVVDASGRRSAACEWLTGLGYPAPEVTCVDGHISYSSRLYEEIRLPEGTGGLFSFARVPDTPRIGVIFTVEGGRSLAFVAGIGKDNRAPTEDKAFLEFARSLIDPIVYEHLRDAKPLTPARAYRQSDNQWRHYAGLARLPERFVPLGDAVCAFNPIYGQGMTVAALEAAALGDEIAVGGLEGIAMRAQKRFEKIIEPAWFFATGEDYRWTTTDGPPVRRQARIGHVYTDHVLALAVRDPKIAAVLVEVGQMTRPIRALFAARILLRVLGRLLTGKGPAVPERLG
jgi:2-polyprenyl-6-methoxyphenol hydroxylase-like FAD-dependent oxidoreductase